MSSLSGERIVILSTHIVSDVEATASQIAIINKGALICHTTPEALLQKVQGKVWTWVVPSRELAAVNQQHIVSGTISRTDGIHVRAVADEPPTDGAESVAPTLEDAYLYSVAESNGGVA